MTARVPDSTKIVLMGDRESDVYDGFIAPKDPQQHWLVRGAQNRKLADPPQQPLWEVAEVAPVLSTMKVGHGAQKSGPARTRGDGRTTDHCGTNGASSC